MTLYFRLSNMLLYCARPAGVSGSRNSDRERTSALGMHVAESSQQRGASPGLGTTARGGNGE
jgi:hypothetical protein